MCLGTGKSRKSITMILLGVSQCNKVPANYSLNGSHPPLLLTLVCFDLCLHPDPVAGGHEHAQLVPSNILFA